MKKKKSSTTVSFCDRLQKHHGRTWIIIVPFGQMNVSNWHENKQRSRVRVYTLSGEVTFVSESDIRLFKSCQFPFVPRGRKCIHSPFLDGDRRRSLSSRVPSKDLLVLAIDPARGLLVLHSMSRATYQTLLRSIDCSKMCASTACTPCVIWKFKETNRKFDSRGLRPASVNVESTEHEGREIREVINGVVIQDSRVHGAPSLMEMNRPAALAVLLFLIAEIDCALLRVEQEDHSCK